MSTLNNRYQAKGLSYKIGDQLILKNISFELAEGEIYSLIGPSGAGKTTLLSLLGGLKQPTTGELVASQGPVANQKVAFVPQDYGLLPWQTVEKAVITGAKLSRKQSLTAANLLEVEDLLQQMNLFEHRKKYPNQLSGGQKQRVAIARGFATCADLLLMDEPFSALDAFTREKAQQLFLTRWQKNKPLTVFVTHDIEEAILLSDKIIVLSANPGEITQIVSSPFADKMNLAENRQSMALFELTNVLRGAIGE